MDAITLDGIVVEARTALVGRHVRRVRLAGPDALVLDAGRRERLVLSARRGSPGPYLVDRDSWGGLPAPPEPGRAAAHLLLRLRSSVQGTRLGAIERVAGERTLLLHAGGAVLALRLSGPAPALSLAVDGSLAGNLGGGPPAWPPPEPRPEAEWCRLTPEAFAAAVEALRREGRSVRRACLAACPGLGPTLARELDGSAVAFDALLRRLARPAPTLTTARPLEECDDADLVPQDAVQLAPLRLTPGAAQEYVSWEEASAAFLRARWRGDAFAQRRQWAMRTAREHRARLERLLRGLDRDAAGLPDPVRSRRLANALLARMHDVPPGARRVDVADPEDDAALLSIALDPALGPVENAELLFRRARRADRARGQLQRRRAETAALLVSAREAEQRVDVARNLADLDAPLPGPRGRSQPLATGPPRFLTTRGLPMLVGRGARENHHVTFELARPDDYWFHVRDTRGAHVVVRDPEGRATATDLREAAEVAAHYSEAGSEPAVDVHVARRKHLRPVRGSPGRVVIGHAETLRVAPRDPEGRLRRR